MGRAVRLKQQRRSMRRELERQLRDPQHNRQVEQAVSDLRHECFAFLALRVDEVLHKAFGFGPKRRARLWGMVKGGALWEAYMERGLPLDEIAPRRPVH